MGKAKPTLGPWEVIREAKYDEKWQVPIASTLGAYIIVAPDKRGYTTEIEREANARLIASAPDLLKVLQELVSDVETRSCESGGITLLSWINAKEIIAKATGDDHG